MNASDQLFIDIFGADSVPTPPLLPPICPFPPPAQAKAKILHLPAPERAKPWDIIKLAHRVNYKFHNGFDESAFCKRFNMHTYGQLHMKVA